MKARVSLEQRLKNLIPVGATRSLAEVARELKVSRKAVEEEVDGSYNGLGLLVGIRCGSGIGRLPKRDWEVEHYQA